MPSFFPDLPFPVLWTLFPRYNRRFSTLSRNVVKGEILEGGLLVSCYRSLNTGMETGAMNRSNRFESNPSQLIRLLIKRTLFCYALILVGN